jgi:hypothetical protein
MTFYVVGQDFSNIRHRKIKLASDTTILDSLLIVPGSVHVVGYKTTAYKIIAGKSAIIWLTAPIPSDTIGIWYRVYPSNLSRVYKNKSADLIDAELKENPFAYIPKDERRYDNQADDIRTMGNISRGIGFGNRQDVVVNSNLNLRLSGKIQDDVEIIAAISDENNPIQPEGNTQQIQEFDRIYIQIKKDSTLLTAGDFQMVTPNRSYFMKYNKKSRGLQIAHTDSFKGGRLQIGVEGAVSRGRFSRNLIAGIEGNQGPYRLQGANGEIFIIIISGTEQVYLDGALLVRGEQNDYVIDYNSGELRFMPAKLITAYSRIVVEFQYSDRNYGRSVFRTGAIYSKEKWRLRVNYFTEQDNKNQPFQLNLDLYDSISKRSAREILSLSGDNDFAYIPRVDSLNSFDPSIIQYYKKDSLGFVVYEHAETSDSGKSYFQLGFSFVGSGNGNYVQKLSNANGKVFQWVEPVNGTPAGDYDAVEILIAPKRLQVLNVGVDFQPNKRTISSLELVRSDNDLNTFSSVNDNNNVGYGLKYNMRNESKVLGNSINGWKVLSHLSYEHTQKNFQYVERYRNVEFDRQWNRTLTNPSQSAERNNENIAIADFQIAKGKNLRFNIKQTLYANGSDFGGYSQNYKADWRTNRIGINGGFEQVTSNSLFQTESINNEFSRLYAEVNKRGKWVNTAVKWQRETSSFGVQGDSLLPQSYQYENRKVNFSNGDSMGLNWRLDLGQRLDYAGGNEGRYKAKTDGRDASLQFGWRGERNTSINLTGTYRLLQFVDSTTPSENTTQGRIEFQQSFLKRVIRTSSYYQLGTGQEQKREFTYLEVGDGNGAYVWNDYDSNKIQALNEFELASEFDRGRANFIRQFLPVQGFIKSYSSEFNYNLRLQPAAVWAKSEKKLKKFIGRFSNVSAFQVQKKVTDNTAKVFLNPLALDVQDTLLLTTNSAIRSVFSFNQSSPIFGIDYQWFKNQNKQLLVNGVDARSMLENKIKFRYNVKRRWEINLSSTSGSREYISAFLTTRSYSYDFISFRPKIGYQYKRNLRVEFYYDYFEAGNLIDYGGEQTFNHDFTTEFRLNYLNQGIIRLSFGVVEINYTGNDNSPVAYELLNGLKNGRNSKWNLQIEQRFSNSIQLLVTYDGRKSIDSPIIHIGRVQARYLF